MGILPLLRSHASYPLICPKNRKKDEQLAEPKQERKDKKDGPRLSPISAQACPDDSGHPHRWVVGGVVGDAWLGLSLPLGPEMLPTTSLVLGSNQSHQPGGKDFPKRKQASSLLLTTYYEQGTGGEGGSFFSRRHPSCGCHRDEHD